MNTKTDKHPTLATIAEAVGVSRMTVSNAYNRPDQLSPALREKILETAKELGYGGPDPVARTLKRGETGSVGVVLDYALTNAFTDSATVEFLHGVAAGCEAEARGLSLVPRISGKDALLVGSALVDGFVVYCVPEDDPRWDAIRSRKLPFVRVDFDPDPTLPSVNIDDEGAARRIAEHLLALGHRRFGIVLSQDEPGETALDAQRNVVYHVEAARLAGWRTALEAAGVDWSTVPVAGAPGKDNAVRRDPYDLRRGRTLAGATLLDRADRPTAILALSDQLALGVLAAAEERGIDVPGQLSVAGFDDIPEAAVSTPTLTTVRQPHHRKGAEAVRLLLDGGAAQQVLLPTELVIRASTGPAPRKESSP
jgi:DNA-binding LacI/PurR family transcriptional regulator